MIKFRTTAAGERPAAPTPQNSSPAHAESFAAQLHAAREECVSRSQTRPHAAPKPLREALYENSMSWLSERTRLKNATRAQTRALVLTQEEEWAEECDERNPQPKKPRAPRTIDY